MVVLSKKESNKQDLLQYVRQPATQSSPGSGNAVTVLSRFDPKRGYRDYVLCFMRLCSLEARHAR